MSLKSRPPGRPTTSRSRHARAVRFAEWSPGRRAALAVGVVVDVAGRIAMLVDLRRRPSTELSGPRWAWTGAALAISSAGLVPALYFAVHRHRRGGRTG